MGKELEFDIINLTQTKLPAMIPNEDREIPNIQKQHKQNNKDNFVFKTKNKKRKKNYYLYPFVEQQDAQLLPYIVITLHIKLIKLLNLYMP